jgi:hypothetical protein
MLEDSVFRPLKNVHHPFWDTGKSLLDDYYNTVFPYFDLDINYDQLTKEQRLNQNKSSGLENKLYFAKLGEAKRFSVYKGHVEKSNLIHLLTNCRVEKILSKGSKVESLVVRDIISGKVFNMNGNVYACCGGAIETTRLLLNSTNSFPALKNNFNIGKGFYDHLGIYGTIKIYTNNTSKYKKYIWKMSEKISGIKFMYSLNLSVNELNGNSLIPIGITHLTIQKNNDNLTKEFKSVVQGLVYISNNDKARSRLFLSKKLDRFGLNKIDIEFNVDSYDYDIIKKSVDLLAKNITSSGSDLVKIDTSFIDNLSSKDIVKGSHHQGCLRMAHTSEEGVVDTNLKVFGVDNLYISSSGVFPTTGISNPTIHIGALSVMLARKIASKIKSNDTNASLFKGIFFLTSKVNNFYRDSHFTFNDGWNKLEPNGRWTSEKSILGIVWPSSKVKKVKMFIALTAYTHPPKLKSQAIYIQLDNINIYKEEESDGQKKTIEINIKSPVNSNTTYITFLVPNAGMPSYFNPGYSDNRVLGAYLTHIYYEFY